MFVFTMKVAYLYQKITDVIIIYVYEILKLYLMNISSFRICLIIQETYYHIIINICYLEPYLCSVRLVKIVKDGHLGSWNVSSLFFVSWKRAKIKTP